MKLREENGDAEDESNVAGDNTDGAIGEVRKCCVGLEPREGRAERADAGAIWQGMQAVGERVEGAGYEFRVGYDAGYEAGLKAGIKMTRRPGDLKRGAEECGLLRKQRARLGWSRKGLLVEEQKRSLGTGRDIVGGWAGFHGVACMHWVDEQHVAEDKQRLELALMVRKRKMERREAADRETVRKSVLLQSQRMPYTLFGGGRKVCGGEKSLFRKRSGAGSLTLVGTRETVVIEKGRMEKNSNESERQGFWASIKGRCRSLKPQRSAKETEGRKDWVSCILDLGTREAWWSCR